ncbi:MAG TPA: basic secretory protein-like protein [Polyangiaceae bacterium]|nr:basic secretory protein-like protein [Polyangiaceae bacterium]
MHHCQTAGTPIAARTVSKFASYAALIATAALGSACSASVEDVASEEAMGTASSALVTTLTSSDGKYTLIVDNRDPRLAASAIKNLTDTFFLTYPKLVTRWNVNAAKTVKFVFRLPNPGENLLAGTANDEITFNSQYIIDHPQDWDVVVHEETHVVQSGFKFPGWLIEGQADYARATYGRNNAANGWPSPLNLSVNYTAGYWETGAFIKWVERTKRATLLDDLTRNSQTYTDDLWRTLTGRTIVQLWNEYNPSHPIPEAGVTFFADVDYGGYAVTLTRGTYTLAQLRAAGISLAEGSSTDTAISSIKVSSGFSVIVYDRDNIYFTPNNPQWWFNANTPNFTNVTVNGVQSNINDIVSSIWIY